MPVRCSKAQLRAGARHDLFDIVRTGCLSRIIQLRVPKLIVSQSAAGRRSSQIARHDLFDVVRTGYLSRIIQLRVPKLIVSQSAAGLRSSLIRTAVTVSCWGMPGETRGSVTGAASVEQLAGRTGQTTGRASR